MENIFENAYFGKPYKTRDGRKALFSRKDGDIFDLETEDSYNPVRSDGSFLYTKEGYESGGDIISEWQEEINEEELDELATKNTIANLGYNFDPQDYTDHYGTNAHWASYKQGWKDAYRQIIEKYN